MSSVAVLDEIGISEIRLRDTMLRAVNATELFANAQDMAAEGNKITIKYRVSFEQFMNKEQASA